MRFDAQTLFFPPLFLILVGMFSARFLILLFVFFLGWWFDCRAGCTAVMAGWIGIEGVKENKEEKEEKEEGDA